MNADISSNQIEMVQVNLERIRSLEKLEDSLSSIVVKAINDYKSSKLKELHERDKKDPGAVKIRVKRYLEKHRDEVNKRRRDKRKEHRNAEKEKEKDLNNKQKNKTIIEFIKSNNVLQNTVNILPSSTTITNDIIVNFE